MKIIISQVYWTSSALSREMWWLHHAVSGLFERLENQHFKKWLKFCSQLPQKNSFDIKTQTQIPLAALDEPWRWYTQWPQRDMWWNLFTLQKLLTYSSSWDLKMPQSIVVWKVFPTKTTNIDHYPKDFSLGQLL